MTTLCADGTVLPVALVFAVAGAVIVHPEEGIRLNPRS